MRAAAFAQHIPEVVPDLVSVAGLNIDKLRQYYNGFAGVQGREEAMAADFVQLQELPQALNTLTFADCREKIVRLAMEKSLAAMTRIAEYDLSALNRRETKRLGGIALGVTRASTYISTITGPVWGAKTASVWGADRYGAAEQQQHAHDHYDEYARLLPYMDKGRAEHIKLVLARGTVRPLAA